MRVDESPITLREIEKRDARREPSERELLLLFGVSFATIWVTIFLLHRSTALVFADGDNVAYRDVANAILHWDFRSLQLQRFMGYPYFIRGLMQITPDGNAEKLGTTILRFPARSGSCRSNWDGSR